MFTDYDIVPSFTFIYYLTNVVTVVIPLKIVHHYSLNYV